MSRPDIADALWWFEQTHEAVPTWGGMYWRLAWLPGPGNVGEQDAWLWDALQIVRAERTAALVDDIARRSELDGWRQGRVRQLRGA